MKESVETVDPPQRGDTGPGRRLGDLLGAFRVTLWEAGRRATYVADEDAPGGRPFVDVVEVEMGRPLRDQALALELGKADLAEIGPGEARRGSAAARRIWSSAPVRLIALVVGLRVQSPVREALALAIDRGAIHGVLLQKQGDLAGGLLPQWLSGYAFLFNTARDLARARSLLARLPAAERTLSAGYEPADPQSRAIIERIALNAREAGLLVSVGPYPATSDLKLVETRMASAEPSVALPAAAAALGLPEPAKASTAEAIYEAERSLVESFRAIPLFHIPETWASGPRLRTWRVPPIGRLGDWRLDWVWLEDRRR